MSSTNVVEVWDSGASADKTSSASPLNGEAATLWDQNQEEFKRKVLARHVDVKNLEDTS